MYPKLNCTRQEDQKSMVDPETDQVPAKDLNAMQGGKRYCTVQAAKPQAPHSVELPAQVTGSLREQKGWAHQLSA